jgi:hypothetical protein
MFYNRDTPVVLALATRYMRISLHRTAHAACFFSQNVDFHGLLAPIMLLCLHLPLHVRLARSNCVSIRSVPTHTLGFCEIVERIPCLVASRLHLQTILMEADRDQVAMLEERVILTDYFDNAIGSGSKKESTSLLTTVLPVSWHPAASALIHTVFFYICAVACDLGGSCWPVNTA